MVVRFNVLLLIAFICLREDEAQSPPSLNKTSSIPVTSDWINNLSQKGYDRSRSPAHDGLTTPVKIGIYVENMGNFQATSMDYDIDLYFKEWWQDARLAHRDFDLPGFNEIELINKIWRPDLYFANSKTASTNLLTTPNTHMRIDENGSVFYSVRVNLKLSCNMDFRSYPLDQQMCTMRIISYGYTVEEMSAVWDDSRPPINVNPLNEASELSLFKFDAVECDGRYPLGVFSCLEARFYLHRHVTFYLIQNFIPTGLIVCVSWISFWIDPTSVPGRVTLAVSTLLTIATQSAAIMQKLPPVTYTKAIDVWLGACMIFVFGTLLEYACVNSLRTATNKKPTTAKTKPRKSDEEHLFDERKPILENGLVCIAALVDVELALRQKKNELLGDSDGFAGGNCAPYTTAKNPDGYSKALRLDRICRAAFPSAFVAFNIVYWLKYWYFGRVGLPVVDHSY